MIKPICTDNFILSRPCLPIAKPDKADLAAAQDLLDTLGAHLDGCVGMAANMIGEPRRIIVFLDGNTPEIMISPEIVGKSEKTYDTEEGCLSHDGTKPVTRYEKIEVEFLNMRLKKCRRRYIGFTAQIIQHEIDHCNGILI